MNFFRSRSSWKKHQPANRFKTSKNKFYKFKKHFREPRAGYCGTDFALETNNIPRPRQRDYITQHWPGQQRRSDLESSTHLKQAILTSAQLLCAIPLYTCSFTFGLNVFRSVSVSWPNVSGTKKSLEPWPRNMGVSLLAVWFWNTFSWRYTISSWSLWPEHTYTWQLVPLNEERAQSNDSTQSVWIGETGVERQSASHWKPSYYNLLRRYSISHLETHRTLGRPLSKLPPHEGDLSFNQPLKYCWAIE